MQEVKPAAAEAGPSLGRTSRLSLRSRLLLLAAAIALPCALLLGWAMAQVLRAEEAVAISRLSDSAERAAAQLDVVLRERRELLARLANGPALRSLSAADCGPLLQNFVRLHPEYLTLSVRRRDGGLVCSTLSTPNPPERLRAFPWFQGALDSDGFVVSDGWRGAVTGRWSTMLSQPVLDSAGKPAALVLLPLDLLKTQDMVLRAADLSARMITTVIDRQGVVLMRSA